MIKKSYYRSFTDLLPKPLVSNPKKLHKSLKSLILSQKLFWSGVRFSLKIFILLNLLLFAVLLSYVIYSLKLEYNKVKERRVEELKSLTYWQNVISKHPDYPDGYYEVAWHSFVLGEKQNALEALTKALFLDPSFKEAKELKEKITRN